MWSNVLGPNGRGTLSLLADSTPLDLLYACEVLRESFTEAWNEPSVPSPPERVWRDWVLLAIFLPGAAVEIFLRDDAGWKPAAIAISLALAVTLLWRRTHPLTVIVAAFASITIMDIASRVIVDQPLEYFTGAVVLILPYALFRWGSGKEAMIGLILMIAMWAFSISTSWTGIGDAIGGFIVLMFPTALGDLVRNQHRARLRAVDDAKTREREQLARELHDTVAHHVSAIAIQAQAGQAVAATNPAAAIEALAVIEQEASKTLLEMRTMVSALRAGEAELAPQAAFHDIERLAAGSTSLPITVERVGDLDHLSPPVDRALFRLAQESITNAIRHAKNATGVTVRLIGEGDEVRLSVLDDGDPRSFSPDTTNGFGLIGMNERAHLLGGTLEAGPKQGRGWRVEAVLPKTAKDKTGNRS